MLALPTDPRATWPGRDHPFSTKAQREDLDTGRPFAITAGLTDFDRNTDGKPTTALLIQPLRPDDFGPEGEPFVITWTQTPSRIKMVQLLEDSGQSIGPVAVKFIPSDQPGRKPFRYVTSYQDKDPGDSEPL